MPSFERDGVAFNYLDTGSGTPFVFEHGLGGDVNQPFSLFRAPAGFRLLSFDARGHGQTCPLGDEEKISLASFADDLLFFLDYLAIDRAVVGGISMGSAVGISFALRYPHRALGLVLSRPAWLDRARPESVYWCTLLARLIREHGARRGKELYLQSPEYEQLFLESSDVADSLARQFDNLQAEEAVARLERIPRDAPCRSLEELKAIRVPTLVLANRQDPIHPFEYGQILAQAIPGAAFRELTPKSVNREQHAIDVQNHIEAFLVANFGRSVPI